MTHNGVLGMKAKAIDKGINGFGFQQFLREESAPKLWSGAVVVMDNLPVHMQSGDGRVS